MRLFENLTATQEPAWPELRRLVAEAPVTVEVLPPDAAASRRTLEQLQVTTRSFLGAVVVETGGLVIDHGWLRVYGSPSTGIRLPGLASVNDFPAEPTADWSPAHGIVVGHDVLGGTYVLNGSEPAAAGRPGTPGEMIYLAPDTLQWERLEAGHAAWLTWVLDGGLAEFTEGLRWEGWDTETRGLNGDRGLHVFPPLWTREAHEDLAATSRAVVPMAELLGVTRSAAAQIDDADLGPLGAF
ncbi:DUF2625 family protein [Promicromonospora thailandica]|uniref:DUF2625 family protein n=1 Tax=Promicromonospora thailandica TaxID=765201 RepID=A0A9X2G037_9MICO|nr:DUF2625 family protein [Promicromonospora thailandica]MCP2262752.1 Protein of unknown function DUF2625 [Promicromonospora thailandica]BFF18077.1 DUF2625 domain-containing protein [Promicromonospora thailandica]